MIYEDIWGLSDTPKLEKTINHQTSFGMIWGYRIFMYFQTQKGVEHPDKSESDGMWMLLQTKQLYVMWLKQ